MLIRVNIRNIPEISEAYKHRLNRKDSFARWLKKTPTTIIFHLDGQEMVPVTD